MADCAQILIAAPSQNARIWYRTRLVLAEGTCDGANSSLLLAARRPLGRWQRGRSSPARYLLLVSFGLGPLKRSWQILFSVISTTTLQTLDTFLTKRSN